MLSADEQRTIVRLARGMHVAKRRVAKQMASGLITARMGKAYVKAAEVKFKDFLKEVG